ncbi:serine/threonine-protein kinase [Enhygromyxa salina]|uniref:serine/threonine-protein kinase n=1 Tax=Enhygromyxa salina TaxID=215803 RepID=UPI0011B25130|nr:serine/threonine-protein kinase [Enhygromyxa salina]
MAKLQAEDDETQRSTPLVEIGQRFADRYMPEALLGRGGMGAVYRVRDLDLDEVVALKLLEVPDTTSDAIERFRREVRLARRVTHRNTARTYDLGEHRGFRFLTMEFVAGESLRELQSKRRIELGKILDIARQIAEGLAAAHAAQVVHRDLKPANVLVEPGGRAVITDFGIARGVQGSDATLQTHGTLGTPAYMAPEQLAGERVSAASDVYSLGLIVHELLTGELPFKRATTMETALARLHATPPDLSTSHDLEPGLAALVGLMLSREIAERPGAADVAVAIAEQQAELEALRASEGSLSSPTPIRRLALAVLPFLHRGSSATAYIGEALGDELIDLLAMTKGLRVSGSGATARYAERRDRDPRAIGRELGVEALVDGTVHVAGERVRISARLLDGETGFQRWSGRFEGALSDVFELQDKMGKRIAEALRMEVEQSVHRGDATPEAVEHYLRARQLARVWAFKGPDGAVARLQQCLALAPSFKPAMAAYADACLRAWFLPREPDEPDEPDYRAMAEAAVEAALGWAPELAETHLASARWSTQAGDYRGAAQSLQLALSIAPTYAAAHAYIGQLQVEGGRPREGLDHLELGLELDPSHLFCLPAIARYHALRDDLDSFDRVIARFYANEHRPTDVPVRTLELRVGAWKGERARIDAAAAELPKLLPPGSPLHEFHALLWLEEVAADALVARVERMLPTVPNPHFRGSMLQIACEAAMIHAYPELALRWLALAGEGPLADLDWLEHCAVLAPLRSEPLYRQNLATARARAEAIWWR